MYNPYNWKIEKKEIKKNCDCILNELGSICADRELNKIRIEKLEKEIVWRKEKEENLMKKMNFLLDKINKIP